MQRLSLQELLDGRAAILVIARSGGCCDHHRLGARFRADFFQFADLSQHGQEGDPLLKTALGVLASILKPKTDADISWTEAPPEEC